MASTCLDCLPPEILGRIACAAPAESALALAKTCRTLYQACYDTLVFKAILKCQRPLWDDSRVLDVPKLSHYIGPNDTRAWARFAVADQRAMELRDRIGLVDGMRVMYNEYYPRDFESWVPHLFVAGCKSTRIQIVAVTERSTVTSSTRAE